MSTIKVNNIDPPNVGEGVSIDGLQMPTAGAFSNRNLIVNGAMRVAQRSTSSTTGGYSSVDRMKVAPSESNTQSQLTLTSTDTPYSLGFRNAFRLQNTTVSSAGSETWREIDYRIEAQDIANSGWDYTNTSSYITISFWLRASVTQSYYLYIRTQDGTPRLLIKELAVTADTWEKFEFAIPGDFAITMDNDSNLGLLLRFIPWYGDNYTGTGTLDAWTSNTADKVPDMTSTWVTTLNSTFDLTGLQLEVGSKATPFEHESYGQTLAKCQRYFERIAIVRATLGAANCYNATTASMHCAYAITKRGLATTITLPAAGDQPGQLSCLTVTGGYPAQGTDDSFGIMNLDDDEVTGCTFSQQSVDGTGWSSGNAVTPWAESSSTSYILVNAEL
jgi:hypothetical protein